MKKVCSRAKCIHDIVPWIYFAPTCIYLMVNFMCCLALYLHVWLI